MPKKTNKLGIFLGFAIIGVIMVLAIVFFVTRGNVTHDQIVGTWTPPGPPMGAWVRRLEFNADGTGRMYIFDEHHNAYDQIEPFTWHLEGRNTLSTTLWFETATVSVGRRSGQNTLRYRFGNEPWVEFREVRTQRE